MVPASFVRSGWWYRPRLQATTAKNVLSEYILFKAVHFGARSVTSSSNVVCADLGPTASQAVGPSTSTVSRLLSGVNHGKAPDKRKPCAPRRESSRVRRICFDLDGGKAVC